MTDYKRVWEVIAKLKNREEINRDEGILVYNYIQTLAHALLASRQESRIAHEVIRITTQERDEARAERDQYKKEVESLESHNQALKKQLFSERADLREIQALENELDSIWGIWYDTGRSRYVNLNWTLPDTDQPD
jgi:predicted ribosome quality control (RQC) complex YloA/Tae2 family protein